ncbi:hypothetical protein [Reichenbachiella versicolor]|uniref:hypothetical protein n=1 Tax=Reichenbachiella versicolor TaxID=1821036 RepID=UPI000D6EA196|nr:hypothetical protein [Reichenbachiella versicolor]
MEIRKFVGVVPPLAFETLWYPKRLMLMFDELALDLNRDLTGYENYILKKSDHEIQWLSDEGFLTTLSGLFKKERKKLFKEVSHDGLWLLPNSISKEFEKYLDSVAVPEISSTPLRFTASELRKLKNIDAIAISTPEGEQDIDAPITRSSTIRITLSEFPMPADNVPWENIFDFKSDKANTSKFIRLKSWMNRISKTGLKEYELQDELRELLYTYEEGLKLCNMKSQKGALEVILTTSAEVAENILRIKPSKAVSSLFSVREQKIKLLEEEKKLLGREVAYIVSANSKFTKNR